MSHERSTRKLGPVGALLGDMKHEVNDEGHVETGGANGRSHRNATPARSGSSSNISSAVQTPKSEYDEHEIKVDGEIAVKVEAGKPPKLSRKASQKVISRTPPVFDHVPDSTDEATSTFQVIRDCIYGSKYMGSSEHDALGCDCSEEWRDSKNHACGEDSDCINRATKMECIDEECNCGTACQNQRFQRKQFAKVSVIKTEKKGYGLRTDTELQPNDFIFEYIGEVINEPTFRRRTIQYDDEGIKHFYFMSLNKSEFVDATRKGNLGRFCNHSCNPNCYVDKWVVGDKLRMGIFAERRIKAGEELVFNYNVDRYGADPQPCYCAEPNCTGFIGGKTQTERATKLSHATIEALGIDDGDGWDTAVAKRPRKKKVGEDDEEYVNNLQPRGLDEDGVTKVMATLMQCKEKWIAVKLLGRIQRCDDDRVRNRVVRMHGYQILRTTLTTWKDDDNVVLQILDILYKFPRLTRNKISDSKIDSSIETLAISEHEDVAFESKRLLDEWSKLEVAYRIPRKKFDPNAQSADLFDRRGGDREDEASKSPAPTSAAAAPSGPRGGAMQRNSTHFASSSRPTLMRRPFSNPLPAGWFTATDKSGNTYYYSKSGQVTWQRPRQPAPEPPPPPKGPPKAVQNQKALQDIIDSLTKSDSNGQNTSSSTPQRVEEVSKHKKVEKWRSLSREKQMKLYENTLFPHIKHVMDKFRNKLPKDDLKKFAKEIGKTLVASDFKHNRVEDPTKIPAKQEKKVRKYVKEYFDKAVAKKAAHDKAKERKQHFMSNGTGSREVLNGTAPVAAPTDELNPVKAEDSEVEMSDMEDEAEAVVGSIPTTPSLETPGDDSLKRKREELGESYDSTPSETPMKRLKENDLDSEPSPPPPPPPPPDDDMIMAMDEDAELAAQEEALMRENEEALMKENEEALREAERQERKQVVKEPSSGLIDGIEIKMDNDGIVKAELKAFAFKVNGAEVHSEVFSLKEVNCNAVISNTTIKVESNGSTTNESADLDLDLVDVSSIDEKREQLQPRERKEVLSH